MATAPPPLETPRLLHRRFNEDDEGDTQFLVELLNQPSFLKFIGDRGVRNVEQAKDYIRKGPHASFARHGFGLVLVQRKADGVRMGMCGLLQRDILPDVEVGYAFLPEFWGHGYAFESVSCMVQWAKDAELGRLEESAGNEDSSTEMTLIESEVKAVQKETPESEGTRRTRTRRRRLTAVTDPTNETSKKLLGKLGMKVEGEVRLAPEEDMLLLYSMLI